MKNISLIYIFVSVSTTVLAQEVVIDTTNYTPPPVVRERVLMDDPDETVHKRQLEKENLLNRRRTLLEQLKEVRMWYVSAEGGLRNDGSTLTNSFDGLISTSPQTKLIWGALAGYAYKNAWTIEAGYMRSPIQLNIQVANTRSPLVYTYTNNGYAIPIRVKRRLGSARLAKNGTGFWVTGGAWLVPNGSGQKGDFKLIGYNYRGRSRVDTLRLNNTATVLNQITGLVELGLEYTTRLSSYLELGLYGRKYWGLGKALKSELVYTVNGTAQQQAVMTADGTGWGLGLSLRYIYGRQHEVKKLSANAL